MADPASILGTAVGVTSLSIQACQALSQYYTHFQSFDDDIGAIVKRLDGLSQSLEVLEWLRPKVEVQGDPVSSQLQQAVEACTSGLSDLQAMAAKCGELAVPTTLQDKKRTFKKRLLWPFRQETVASMVSTLDGLQANVQLAVQLLNIEAGHRSHQSLETNSNALVAKVEQVQQNQFKALATIQEGFIELHKGHLSDHTATILLHDSKQLSSQIANIEKKMDVMMAIRSNSRRQVYTPNHTVHNSTTSSDCTCRRKRYTQRLWAGFGGLFEVEVTKETEHKPSCRFFRFGSTALVCQTNCKFLKRLLNVEIEAGVSYMQMSGLYTIQPTLTVKPIVSDDSPAFRPIYTFTKTMGCACSYLPTRIYCSWCGSTARAPSDLQTALDEIVQSFRSGLASPHVTTEDGVSVLDLAYDLALHMISAGHLDGQTALMLLEEFVNEGRFRQYSALACVMISFETTYFSPSEPEVLEHAVSVYSHRLSIADTWVDDNYESEGVISKIKHQLLYSEENLAKYDCDCTLHIALHRRSEKALHEAISVHDRGLCEHDSICNDTYGLLLVAWYWPDGLRTLLRTSFLRARGPLLGLHNLYSLDGIVSRGLYETTLESLHILGEAHPMAYWLTFCDICKYLHNGDLDWAETFICDMRERINTGRMTAILGTPYKDEVSFPSFHHASSLRVNSMRMLSDAGITYDDEPKHAWRGWDDTYHFGTPLWFHGFRSLTSGNLYFHEWGLLELMVIHGARLDWKHPELLTTPAHLISLISAWSSYAMETPTSSFLRQVISCKHLDRCTCACSKDGCLTVACAAGSSVTNAPMRHGYTYEGKCRMLSRQFGILCDVVQADPSTRDLFALAVLRVLAFDELGLTHTCCRRLIGHHDAWRAGIHVLEQDPEDLAAFRYSERKDLEALEDLMIKTEHAWAGFSGTFLDFLRLVWLPLMRSRDHEFLAESVSHVEQRLSEVGVNLYMPVGTSTGEAETEEDENDVESVADGLEDDLERYDPWDSSWKHMRPLGKIELIVDSMAKEEAGYDISEEPILLTELPNGTKDSVSQDTRPQDTRSPQHKIEPLRNRHTSAGNEPNTPKRRQSI